MQFACVTTELKGLDTLGSRAARAQFFLSLKDNTYPLFPLLRKSKTSVYYSLFLKFIPLGTTCVFTNSDIKRIATSLKVTSRSVVTLLKNLSGDKYLSCEHTYDSYVVKRSQLSDEGLACIRYHTEKATHSDIWGSSGLLLLAILKVWARPLLPRNKELAVFLGITLQSAVDLKKRLRDKGLIETILVPEELDVKHPKTKKMISIERTRRVSVITEKGSAFFVDDLPSTRTSYKNKKPPESKDSDLSSHKSDFSKIETQLKPHWDTYTNLFESEGESFKATVALLHQKGQIIGCDRDIAQALKESKNLPFLRVANSHNWQEAVVGCYESAGQGIGASSRHIDRYQRGRMTFLWIVRHVQEIVAGKYSPKKPSANQTTFSSWTNDNQKKSGRVARILKPVATKSTVSAEILLKEIEGDTSKNVYQRTLHKELLETVGSSLYNSWCKTLTIDKTANSLILLADSLFVRDALEQRLCVVEGVEVRMKNPAVAPGILQAHMSKGTPFLSDEQNTGASIKTNAQAAIDIPLACPPNFHTILCENVPKTASVLPCSGPSFFLTGNLTDLPDLSPSQLLGSTT